MKRKYERIVLKDTLLGYLPVLLGLFFWVSSFTLGAMWLKDQAEQLGALYPVALLFLIQLWIGLIRIIPAPVTT